MALELKYLQTSAQYIDKERFGLGKGAKNWLFHFSWKINPCFKYVLCH